jgi:iron complex transport system ATP-binding protein
MAGLSLLAFLALVVSLRFGTESIDFLRLVTILFEGMRHGAGEGVAADPSSTILLQIRLPRVVLAFMVGGSLAAVGVVLQALLRNPLADPYVIGVSSGAALGAAIALLFGLGISVLSVSAIPFCAFLGASFSLFIVYRIALIYGGFSIHTLLLAGVVLNAIFSAFIMFLTTLADPNRAFGMYAWLMGSLTGPDGATLGILSVYLFAGILLMATQSHSLNLLTLGEESARSLGVEVERVKKMMFVAAALVTGAVVAFSCFRHCGRHFPHDSGYGSSDDSQSRGNSCGCGDCSGRRAYLFDVAGATKRTISLMNKELNSMPPAYFLRDVSFTYRRGTLEDGKKLTLDNLTLSVNPGEILGVLGPNGSGKSTLLKLLARILQTDRGHIQLSGQDLSGLSQVEVARRVALVPQETQQPFPFTISEMVLMGRFPHHGGLGGFRWETEEDIAIGNQAMQDLDVQHLGARLITDVSGGERQRAIIARALTQEPEVLLLDEPTAFLDLHHQLDIARILRRLNQERGLTVVLVSHDLNLASQYCDRILLLQNGRIAQIGTPEEVIRRDVLESVYQCPVLIDQHPQSGMPRVTLPV